MRCGSAFAAGLHVRIKPQNTQKTQKKDDVCKGLRVQRTACGFPRVAQSCTLHRTGTYPCSASVRAGRCMQRTACGRLRRRTACGFYRELREAHDRTTARWPAAPWMLARAFAKHVKDSMWGSPRVAQSCTLHRTGTYPCSASVRFVLHERSSLTRTHRALNQRFCRLTMVHRTVNQGAAAPKNAILLRRLG